MSLKKDFFHHIPEEFHDPVTGLIPQRETELSALLAHFHLTDQVDWEKVTLRSVSETVEDSLAHKYIQAGVPFYCEYPLFSNSKTVEIWGGMPADLLCFSAEKQKIVLIENKVGSGFTSGGTQLDRQAQYLSSTSFKEKVLIVLGPKVYFEKGWYVNELSKAQAENKGIAAYTLYWEDIFSAIKS